MGALLSFKQISSMFQGNWMQLLYTGSGPLVPSKETVSGNRASEWSPLIKHLFWSDVLRFSVTICTFANAWLKITQISIHKDTHNIWLNRQWPRISQIFLDYNTCFHPFFPSSTGSEPNEQEKTMQIFLFLISCVKLQPSSLCKHANTQYLYIKKKKKKNIKDILPALQVEFRQSAQGRQLFLQGHDT